MINNGFIKVGCATPILKVGNPKFNICEILKMLDKNIASVVVFPELCITGYTCQDLFYSKELLDESILALKYFLDNNKFEGLTVLGLPLINEGSLYNCAVVIFKNEILGVVPKRSLPSAHEFQEKRWFKPAYNKNTSTIRIFDKDYPFGNIIFHDYKNELHIGVEICEDMWSTISPGNILALNGCNIILNLSASNETLGKDLIRRASVIESSRKNCGAYVYASSGVYESSADTVFSGHDIIASCGEIIKECENFSLNSELIYGDLDISSINFKRRSNTNFHDNIHIDFPHIDVCFELETTDYKFEEKINSYPFIPKDEINAYNKIKSLQEYALVKRILSSRAKSVVIGISGGLDSTLALLVALRAFNILNIDKKNIIAVTMPGFGTSKRTKSNATKMMESLGITVLTMPISKDVLSHFELIGHDKNIHDVTYENAQARYRTMILMDLANKYNGFVLGTGDMSELALGWCTYNGDQMSMYGINAGIPKTLVRFMVQMHASNDFMQIKDTLLDIVNTPISPELTDENQHTEDSVGKYEINDFILYRYLSCGDCRERIVYLLKLAFDITEEEAMSYTNKFFFRFIHQQFKRQALPDGPKILDISLNPRGDYRMPSDIERD